MGAATPQECRKEGAESLGTMERSEEMETEKKERGVRGRKKENQEGRKADRKKGKKLFRVLMLF